MDSGFNASRCPGMTAEYDATRLEYSKRKRLTRLEHREAFGFEPCGIERLRQGNGRRIDGFIGELERAVVMRKSDLRAAIAERFHRLLGVHVLIAHEPARLIGTDRQDAGEKLAVALAHIAEMTAGAVSGIADDVDLARR